MARRTAKQAGWRKKLTYKETLKAGENLLEEKGVYPAAAKLLMIAYCSEWEIDLYSDYEKEVNPRIEKSFNEGINRLLTFEPLAYVLGYEPFFGLDFEVDKNVFIPRPETEELVVEVLSFLDDCYQDKQEIKGLDLCTGSGVIATTLVLEEEKIEMWASDIDEKALEVAKRNADKFKTKVNFIQGDLFENIPEDLKFDFIICNPPYIKDDEILENSVKDFEPHVALFAGKDGLDFYRRIFLEASTYLNPKSFLAFEIGYDQAGILRELALLHFSHSKISIKQDLNGKDRMLFIINF